MRRLLSLCLLLGGVAGPAAAEDPKGFVCTFKVGATFTYAKSRFRPAKASPVALDIAGIDHAKQSAELVSGDRKSDLRLIRAVNALHFLEAVGEGYLNLTTVYDRDAGAAVHPAIHSRHFGVLGQPIVSQYRGTCVPR